MASYALQAVTSSLRPSLPGLRGRVRSGTSEIGACPTKWCFAGQERRYGLALASERDDGEEICEVMGGESDAVYERGHKISRERSQDTTRSVETVNASVNGRLASNSRTAASIDYASLVPRPSSHLFPTIPSRSRRNYLPNISSTTPPNLGSPSAIVEQYADSPLPDDPSLIRQLAFKIETLLRSSSTARRSSTAKTVDGLRALLGRIQESAGEVVLRDWASERIGFGLPRRILRSVADDDVEEAETAFRKILPFLLDDTSSFRSSKNAWSPRRFARQAYRMERWKQTEDGKQVEGAKPFLGRSRSERRVLHAYINHLLYLAARAGSSARYHRLYGLLDEYGIRGDSWTYLTRVILADEGKQMGEVARVCGMCWAAQKSVLKDDPTDKIHGRDPSESGIGKRETSNTRGDRVVLNAALWAFAKSGRWDLVGPLYTTLTANVSALAGALPQQGPNPFPSPSKAFYTSSGPPPVTLPAGMLPDKITYQLLVRALAFHGNLKSALLVIQDLSQDPRGYQPDVADFIGLFQGFGRFGNIPLVDTDSESWSANGLGGGDGRQRRTTQPIMPEAIRVDIGQAQKPTSAFRRLTDIWAEQVNSWDGGGPKREAISPVAKALASEWTLPTLEKLFTAFLALKPPRSDMEETRHEDDFVKPVTPTPTAGPSPRGVFYILTAFSRMTNDDKDVLKMVWLDMERKFGDGNKEGWLDWRVDNRLKEMKEGWKAQDSER